MISAMNELPTVSVIIPCRDERRFIGPCLDSLLQSDYPTDKLEILVSDGMSGDGTRDILQEYHRRHSQIRLIDNPAGIVPTAMNQALAQAQGEIIVRMDAHTEYATDYIRQCVMVLQETGAENVGGAHRTRSSGYLQEAIALAFHSPFSAGGALSHDVGYEGPVDSVIYGCWRKKTLLRVGLFDEELVRNQDDELNLRILRSGGKIWQSKRIRSWYQPRASLKALWRQYKQYGYWKVRVIQKHRLPAKFRHLVPGLFVASLFALSAAAPVSTPAFWLWAGLVILYLLANLSASVFTCAQARQWKFLPLMPVIFALYHFGYGYGFLRGVVDFVLLRRGGGTTFRTLSRESTAK